MLGIAGLMLSQFVPVARRVLKSPRQTHDRSVDGKQGFQLIHQVGVSVLARCASRIGGIRAQLQWCERHCTEEGMDARLLGHRRGQGQATSQRPFPGSIDSTDAICDPRHGRAAGGLQLHH